MTTLPRFPVTQTQWRVRMYLESGVGGLIICSYFPPVRYAQLGPGGVIVFGG